MSSSELLIHDGSSDLRPTVAPPANGSALVGALLPTVSSERTTHSERFRTRRIFRLNRSLLVSLLFHLGALTVMAAPIWQMRRNWELQLPRGHNSVALAAYVSSPKHEATATVRISQPQAAALAEPFSRRESELPDTPAAQFASASVDRRVPIPAEEFRRSDLDTPAPPDRPEHVRPKQTAAVRLPQRETAVAVESPASNPAPASAGANRDVPPKLVHEVRPIYPEAAQAAGMQGVVKIQVRVDRRGEVTAASLYQSSGYPLLDQAALEAILRFRFASFEEGTGVAAEFIHPIRFHLPPD